VRITVYYTEAPIPEGGSESTVDVTEEGEGTKIGLGASESNVDIVGEGEGSKITSGSAEDSVEITAEGAGGVFVPAQPPIFDVNGVRTYGLVQAIFPYGGAISEADFIYFRPNLIVNRFPTEVIIDVVNPPSNGSLEILRGDDYIGGFDTLVTVPLSSLPYHDTTINNNLSHKYKGKFVYLFNGKQIEDAPRSNPIYTIKPNGEL
jgi:hypothetical protein